MVLKKAPHKVTGSKLWLFIHLYRKKEPFRRSRCIDRLWQVQFIFTKYILFLLILKVRYGSLPPSFFCIHCICKNMLKYTYVQKIYKYAYITESWTILNLKTNSWFFWSFLGIPQNNRAQKICSHPWINNSLHMMPANIRYLCSN